MSATALLRENPRPSEDEIRKALQGNICRCTGYWNIVEAVKSAGEVTRNRERDRPRSGARRGAEGLGGQSVRRKEDKRLLQGEGVFVDDVKRHGMGYAPLRPLALRARAHHVSSTSPPRRGCRRRLRHADRRRGRGAHRSVLPDLERARREIKDFALAVGRCATSASPSSRSSPRRASSRATPPSSSRSSTSRCPRSSTRARRRIPARPSCTRRPGRTSSGRGSTRGATSTPPSPSRPRRADPRAPLRPLQLDAARVRRRARRVQPRHRAVDDPLEQPVPRLRRDHDGPGDAGRARQAPLRHAGHRRRLRQQDHVAPAARRLLPARAQAQPARPVDGVAHRLPPLDVARQRALVPRHRGGGKPTTGRCSASARRRSTTPERSCATSRSAA